MEPIKRDEFSFKALSEGLGFYEKEALPESDPHQNKAQQALCLPDLPQEFWEAENLDHSKAFERLLSALEKPYLGLSTEKKTFNKNRLLSKPSQKKDLYQLSSISFKEPAVKKTAVKKTSNKVSDKKARVVAPFVSSKATKPVEPAVAAEQAFYFSFKSYLSDFFVVSLLFFPPLLFFIFLTQAHQAGDILKTLWLQLTIGFLLFSQIYCLCCRVFCFETFGESLNKRSKNRLPEKAPSPLLALQKFLISCLTGVVILPVLSFLFKIDWMARLTTGAKKIRWKTGS